MYSVLKSRHNELGFFEAYLSDRIEYAFLSGRITKIPDEETELLAVGGDLSLKEVEAISQRRFPSTSAEVTNDLDQELTIMAAEISPRDHFERGYQDEAQYAERYPSFRWNFPHSKYVLVGIPDGITERFVYEFKAPSKRFFSSFEKPVALAQADLYGLFFDRKEKRVQLLIKDEGKMETYDLPVDANRATETLLKFEKTDSGETPKAPVKWKCKNCDFNSKCSLYQA